MAKRSACVTESNLSQKELIKINGIYTTPTDLNSLDKEGTFKVKLGANRPSGTVTNADALVTVIKHPECLVQSVLILSGRSIGHTFTRSSFEEGIWTGYIDNSKIISPSPQSTDISALPEKEEVDEEDMFILWNGTENFRISAESLRTFISQEHNLGFVENASALENLNGKRGDWIIVGETESIWMWDDIWKDTAYVKSVNKKTGNVEITSEDILGIDKSTIISYLNNIVEVLNGTKFMGHHYSGYTVLGNIQKIPDISMSDNLLLTFGGIVLKQDEDFKITDADEITIIGIEVGRDIPIHVFKMTNFELPKFLKEENSETEEVIVPEPEIEPVAETKATKKKYTTKSLANKLKERK